MASWREKVQVATERAAAENAAYFEGTLKAFRQELAKTCILEDAAARYIAFENLGNRILAEQSKAEDLLKLQNKNIHDLDVLAKIDGVAVPLLGIVGAFLGLALIGVLKPILSAVGAGPALTDAILLIPGVLTSVSLMAMSFGPMLISVPIDWTKQVRSEEITGIVKKAVDEESQKLLFQPLRELQADISYQKASILTSTSLPVFAGSPCFEDLCQRVPSLNRAFLTATKDVAKEILNAGPIRIHKPAPKQSKDA